MPVLVCYSGQYRGHSTTEISTQTGHWSSCSTVSHCCWRGHRWLQHQRYFWCRYDCSGILLCLGLGLSTLLSDTVQGSFPKKSSGNAEFERRKREERGWGGCPLPRIFFQFWVLNRRILVQTGCFLYSSPKAGLNAVPTVKITLGTPFPGVPAGNDPWYCHFCVAMSLVNQRMSGRAPTLSEWRRCRLCKRLHYVFCKLVGPNCVGATGSSFQHY